MEKNNNYLDYVFKIKDGLNWTVNEAGETIVDMENTGFTNRVAQIFFKRPKVSHITLTGLGGFVFSCIDGTKSVYDIGLMVHDKYGDASNPLYERLCVYMKQLENLGFIQRI